VATVAQIRASIVQLYPGVHQDLIDTFIAQAYQSVLDRLSWTRLAVRASIPIPEMNIAGTVAITKGTMQLTGTGTTYSAANDGWLFRLDSGREYYSFRYDSGFGYLDRPFESETVTAATFKLAKVVYQLAPAARLVEAMNCQAAPPGVRMLPTYLSEFPAGRPQYGIPDRFALTLDSRDTDPPIPQIEIYPIPNLATSLAYTYITEDETTEYTKMVWVRPKAIMEHVESRICSTPSLVNNIGLAELHAQRFEQAIAEMVAVEAARRPPIQLRPDPQFTNHRIPGRRRGWFR
jgi:hypothetical protein